MRRTVLSSLALLLLLAGCAETPASPKSGDLESRLLTEEVADGDLAADSFSRRVKIRGTLEYGESVDSAYGAGGYRGWLFNGAAGARIALDAMAVDGTDTVIMLYGPQTASGWSRARPIAVNDDFLGSTNSHLEVRLARAGTYLVIVREYWEDAGDFTLTLACSGAECRAECGVSCPRGSECNRIVCIRAPCPSFCAPIDPTSACTTDADCAAVDTTCCSCAHGGHREAHAASYAADFAPTCDPTEPARCRTVNLCAAEHAACVSNRCEMVATPAPQPGDPCENALCGPRPRSVTLMCADGSLGGNTGRCFRGDDLSCGWEMRPCPAEVRCGARLGNTCTAAQFCDFTDLAMCGRADGTGVCALRPNVTDCGTTRATVCSCNGTNYLNECAAHAAGVDVLHSGGC